MEEQAPGIDTLLVACGGGGLIGGISAWYRGRVVVPACCLIAVVSLYWSLSGLLS